MIQNPTRFAKAFIAIDIRKIKQLCEWNNKNIIANNCNANVGQLYYICNWCKITNREYGLHETTGKTSMLVMLIAIFHQERMQQSYLVNQNLSEILEAYLCFFANNSFFLYIWESLNSNIVSYKSNYLIKRCNFYCKYDLKWLYECYNKQIKFVSLIIYLLIFHKLSYFFLPQLSINLAESLLGLAHWH